MNAAEVLAEEVGFLFWPDAEPDERKYAADVARQLLDALLSLAQPDAEGVRRVVLEGTGGADAVVKGLVEHLARGHFIDFDDRGYEIRGPTYRLVASLPVHEEGAET